MEPRAPTVGGWGRDNRRARGGRVLARRCRAGDPGGAGTATPGPNGQPGTGRRGGPRRLAVRGAMARAGFSAARRGTRLRRGRKLASLRRRERLLERVARAPRGAGREVRRRV